jgi:hypothetical protein
MGVNSAFSVNLCYEHARLKLPLFFNRSVAASYALIASKENSYGVSDSKATSYRRLLPGRIPALIVLGCGECEPVSRIGTWDEHASSHASVGAVRIEAQMPRPYKSSYQQRHMRPHTETPSFLGGLGKVGG